MEEVNKKTYCIVIPAYNEELSETDIISLTSIATKTNNYPNTFIICPENMSIDNYVKIFPTAKKIGFPEVFFKNIYTYSQMCMTYNFYNIFKDYDYMFLFQLDGYMFRDEIQEWVDMGYDYIGAPIFSKMSYWFDVDEKHPKVGNGGVSLRKIKTFRYLTDPNSKFRIVNTLGSNEIICLGVEDQYFCNIIDKLYNFKLKMPNWPDALLFSWDQNVTYIDLILNAAKAYKLPMACHAFCKYKENIQYWAERIPELTKELVNKLLEKYDK